MGTGQGSAGILLWRRGKIGHELLLTHFGGPYWTRRDQGAWSIPKGMIEEGETPLEAARREFAEELGMTPPAVEALSPLGQVRQSGGKLVTAFAAEGDLDAAAVVSMTFEMEWPPRSGQMKTYPEVDRAAWFDRRWASAMILPSLRPLLDRFDAVVGGS